MASPDESPVVVSVTPLNVRADSRTFKQASSVARLGYRSIVVEGMHSDFNGSVLPFELRTVENAGPTPVGEPAAADAGTHPDAAATGPVRTLPFRTRVRVAAWSGLSWLWMRLPHDSRQVAKVPLRSFALRIIRPTLGWTYRRWQAAYWTMRLFRDWRAQFHHRFERQPLDVLPRADVYYLHAFYQYPAVVRACHRWGVPYVYDAHDFYSSMEADTPDTPVWVRMTHLYERWIERRCVRDAAEVVTVSDGLASLMEKRFGRRPLVVRNAPDLRLEEVPRQTVRMAAGVPPDAFLLVVVNNLKPAMAVDELLRALSALPRNVHLAFVGARYESVVPRAAELGVADRTRFLPPVRPVEVTAFIRDADAIVNLYYAASVNYENCLPNNFFSAIAAGVPLLYPELAEMRRIAADREIGVPIDPRSADSIRRGVETLLTEPTRVERIRRSLSTAQPEFTWEREERVIGSMLRDLLGARTAQGRGA